MKYSEPTVETDHYFHIPLPIITKHELGLPLHPRNIPIKFGTNLSTIFLVIVVTDRQTHKQTDIQTNAGKNILPRFRWENKTKYADLFVNKFKISQSFG